MASSPTNYEAWLSLSPEDQEKVHLGVWKTYEREGFGFPFTAAGRLAICSEVKVLDCCIGTYHGGEYVLHMYVSDEDYPSMPKSLKQVFEGFRVIWFPMSQHYSIKNDT